MKSNKAEAETFIKSCFTLMQEMDEEKVCFPSLNDFPEQKIKTEK